MTARRVAYALACALAFGVAANAAPAAAQTTIKVVVNDLPITSYDISQRAALLKLTARPPNPVQLATQELIQERLQMQEARRLRINVSDREVDQAFASIAQRVKLTPAQLGQVLSQAGSSAAELKSRLRAQIAWSQVVRMKFRGSGGVSDQDVIAALGAKGQEKDPNAHKTVEYDISQVVFVVPANASAGQKAARQREAEQLRQRFTSCEQGLAFAKGLSAVVVKPLGKKLQSDMPPQMTQVLDGIGVGKLGPAQPGPAGIELIAVCGRREIDSDAAARATIKTELTNEQGNLAARRYLRDLERNAVIEYR